MKIYIALLVFHLSVMLIISFAFADVVLRITPSSRSKIQKVVAANFPFNPPIQVEVTDNQTRRIKTGYYSSMNISVVASNSTICVSKEAPFQLRSGFGIFTGSICSQGGNISIRFTASNRNGSLISSDWTPVFTVSGDIYVASFENTAELGTSSLIMGAIEDVNNGLSKHTDNGPILPGRTLKLSRYTHGGNNDQAVEAFRKMENDFKIDPESRTSAVLGLSNNAVSELLLPMLMVEEFSVLSYANDSLDKFSNKVSYPYFNRIVYSDTIKQRAYVAYLLSRKWKNIIVLESSDSMIGAEFIKQCRLNMIVIQHLVTFPTIKDYDKEPAGRFKAHFSRIRSLGVHMIVTAIKKPTSFYVFTEALRENITSTFGYQWIGFDIENDFPLFNQPKACQSVENLCNLAFKGMIFMTSHYQISGYSSPQWEKSWKRYCNIDEENEKNDAIKLWKSGSQYGMAYDSIHIYAVAFRKLIDQNRTIHGPELASTVRQIQLTNFMMENVSFSSTGDPPRYFGRLSLVWPNRKSWEYFHGGKVKAGWVEPWDWSLSAAFSNPTNGYLIIDPLNLYNVIEVKSDGGSFMLHTIDVMKDTLLKTGYIDADEMHRNLRRYRSYRGLFALDEQRQVEEGWSFVGRTKRRPIKVAEIWREEFVPLPFHCHYGCGGKIIDVTNALSYENGLCISMNVCFCRRVNFTLPAWIGSTCEIPVCLHGCYHGNCTRPNTCVCQSGWMGLACNQANCSRPLCNPNGGECIAPELCVCNRHHYGSGCVRRCSCRNGICKNGISGDGTCSSCNDGYIGINCTINIYAVFLPSIFGVLLLALITKSCVSSYIKRSMLRSKLHSDDWIVTWSDLKRSDIKAEKSLFLAEDFLSRRQGSKNRKAINTGTWRGFDVHYQRFNRVSIEADNTFLYEMGSLIDMKHNNLVNFVGACLQAPNVSVLTELASKGSLMDILKNEFISLPWMFKYSLLKDICHGLEYIHQSEIGSHGRLKSSNCLIYSRWTLKLSGFGLNRFREEDNEVKPFHSETRKLSCLKQESSEEGYFNLFWTPPELLKAGIFHLDQVGNGTKEGDVYSFAVIFSEICTRERPFEDLSLTNHEIVDLIADRTTPQIIRVWNSYLARRKKEAGALARPCIMKKYWPKDDRERNSLKILIEKCWTTDPLLRPIPRVVLRELKRIDPDSGESIEKVVSMLEKYSNSLEEVVAERATSLSREKQKTDNLISHLLPRPVVEDLKLGKSVEAERFECISILISDFVDFYTVVQACTPSQIIATLESVYECFDNIVFQYDAHKIDTIGNSYMVVSGLPIVNKKQHADILATIALEIMDCIKCIKISHLPEKTIQIRLGIHSGSVVAGVVGFNIPRYCVFGDTVKVAFLMESTSQPMRIQITSDTKRLIEGLKYDVELHGLLKFKQGRAHVTAWWLNGGGIKRAQETQENIM